MLALAIPMEAGTDASSPSSPREALAQLEAVKRQAFTLLCEAYREVRRAVCLLRDREGDAERIAPLPYAQRSKRKPRTRASADSKNHTE